MKAEETVFRTIVEVPKWSNPMQQSQHFVLLGSCFAQHIGELFLDYGLNCVCNPLGLTYNPKSIAIQVREALEGFSDSSIFHFDGKWRCWWASTLISDTDEKRFRKTLPNTFAELGKALRNADYLFITLGTNVCYLLRESGMVVANCHKAPSKLFDEIAIDIQDCIKTISDMMELLVRECPKLQVVLTVSPYRYRKYGFHGNQLAKANLLLAIDEICCIYPEKAMYFPAYEILLDELRDYRFYADDMIHPAPVAVNYIWQKLVENCMDEEMQQHLKNYEPIRKAKGHKPLNSSPLTLNS